MPLQNRPMNYDLEQRYRSLKQQIAQLSAQHKQPEPKLLAVSKKHSSEAIRALHGLGQTEFGESYWQETEQKIAQLGDLNITWHFIGPIQSNKTRPIAENMDWVHSVDRLKIAQRLNDQRPDNLPPLNVCLQINLDDETSKSGVPTTTASELAHAIAQLPRLTLRGLMCIPKRTENPTQQRAAFAKLRQLQQQLINEGLSVDTLSMGMSGDMEAAIAEGSNYLRIGTALFGHRQKNVTNPS